MVQVGIRELKSQLSRYLSQVKKGETVVVTERGVPIALIVPSGTSRVEETMKRLVSQGVVHWAGGKPKGSIPRVRLPGKPLSEYVLEGRD